MSNIAWVRLTKFPPAIFTGAQLFLTLCPEHHKPCCAGWQPASRQGTDRQTDGDKPMPRDSDYTPMSPKMLIPQ